MTNYHYCATYYWDPISHNNNKTVEKLHRAGFFPNQLLLGRSRAANLTRILAKQAVIKAAPPHKRVHWQPLLAGSALEEFKVYSLVSSH